MPVIRETVEINADPEAVFDLITRIEEFASYTDALEEVRAIGPDTYRWTARARGIRLEWDSVVTELERPKRLAWQSIRGVVNSGGYTLRPSAAGTMVTISMEYSFPSRLLEKLLAPLTDSLTRRVAAEVLGRVKSRLEDGDRAREAQGKAISNVRSEPEKRKKRPRRGPLLRAIRKRTMRETQ